MANPYVCNLECFAESGPSYTMGSETDLGSYKRRCVAVTSAAELAATPAPSPPLLPPPTGADRPCFRSSSWGLMQSLPSPLPPLPCLQLLVPVLSWGKGNSCPTPVGHVRELHSPRTTAVGGAFPHKKPAWRLVGVDSYCHSPRLSPAPAQSSWRKCATLISGTVGTMTAAD